MKDLPCKARCGISSLDPGRELKVVRNNAKGEGRPARRQVWQQYQTLAANLLNAPPGASRPRHLPWGQDLFFLGYQLKPVQWRHHTGGLRALSCSCSFASVAVLSLVYSELILDSIQC